MHAERSASAIAEIAHHTEAVVMMLLLESEHSPWTRTELEREIAGVKGNPIEVTDAIDNLHGSGLVHVSGELVTPTRAARRIEELDL